MFKNRLDFENTALDALGCTSFPTKSLLKILFREEPALSLLDWFSDIEDVENKNLNVSIIGNGAHSIIRANEHNEKPMATKWFIVNNHSKEYCFKAFVQELCNYLVLKTVVYRTGDRDLQRAFVTFKNLVHHDGFFGIVMERLYKENLEFLLDSAIEILRKINFLQVQGVYLLHGDMKEPNIMITGSRELRIIDFGMTIYRIEFDDEEKPLENFCYFAPERSIKELLHVDIALLGLSMGGDFERFYEKAYDNLSSFHEAEPFDFGKHVGFYTE